jgi:Ca-activated chloride channel family protein
MDNLNPGTYTVSVARKGFKVPPLPDPSVAVNEGKITYMRLQLGEGQWLEQQVEQTEIPRQGKRVLADGVPVPVTKEIVMDEEQENTSTFAFYPEPDFVWTRDQAKAAWSAENDAAFYTIVQRMIQQGVRPPAGAVRIQELLAHFTWHDPMPKENQNVILHAERGPCPWDSSLDILRLSLRTRAAAPTSWPATRFLFLVDVSGSMEGADRLSLVRSALRRTIDALGVDDEVAIVTYRDRAAVRLPFVSASYRETILRSIGGLKPDGGTAGESGLRLAYETARQGMSKEKATRIIVFSDGDFNVGPHTDAEIAALLMQLREERIGLTVLGFGTGNYQDSKLDLLAKKGNGQYAYVDNLETAMRALDRERQSKRIPVANDVRLMVTFDTAYAHAWRLLGYDNRMLTNKEFRHGDKDGVNLGANEHASALFLIRPGTGIARNDTECTVRYQDAASGRLRRFRIPLPERQATLSSCSDDFRFAAAVAGFGMLLRNSEVVCRTNVPELVALADEAKGLDLDGQRALFVELMKSYEQQDASGTLQEPIWQRATGAR